eukprot:29969_1
MCPLHRRLRGGNLLHRRRLPKELRVMDRPSRQRIGRGICLRKWQWMICVKAAAKAGTLLKRRHLSGASMASICAYV